MRKATKRKPGKTVRPAATAAPKICPHCGGSLDANPVDLTTRQAEVLRLVARGMNRTEIAAELGISKRTVEYHRLMVMERLRLKSIAALALYAASQGLV